MDNDIIGIKVIESSKSNGRARVYKYKCFLDGECPLYKNNKCLLVNILSSGCVYGETEVQESVTKRAKSYLGFIEKWESESNKYKQIEGYYNKCLCQIGEYIYLPYSFMNNIEGKELEIPFEQYDNLFISGSRFMRKEDFNVETIIKLTKLVPRAFLTGQGIKEYQEKILPTFLHHLRNKFPKLYSDVIKKDSSIKEYIDNIKFPDELKCSLKYIPFNKTDGYIIHSNFEVSKWDGVYMTLEADKLLLISNIKSNNKFKINFEPDKEQTTVKVIDKKLIQELCLSHPELMN
ncbi:MAG: hypothetical protein ACOCRK_02400 [bacterium]